MASFRLSLVVPAVLAGGLLALMAPTAHADPYGDASGWNPYWRPRPIFMTSINYPGVYGFHVAGVPALAYNTRTSAENWYHLEEVVGVPPRPLVASAPLPPPPPPAPEPAGESARVNVLLPSDATLTIEGVRMSPTGTFREFVSPPLVPGPDYTYTVRATWTQNGKPVSQERVVHVAPGARVDVDLMNAAPRVEEPSTLQARPAVPVAR
jgi:uncharacterized protein (TIGR03000 family)